ncbi:putative RNA-directed DNA polymerase from transposon X-element [Stylophora pistillata]|uniref:Putative RNA-directed DNA polymerase from transposon X-element n=1 Tax=Stylophora pistillata TaxID=50429 RepID=A0A2B4R716_STYPI|nr:putative RNA-directed DNA polymerase from transposon X-element [Stylophora pistillata]
MEVPSPVGLGQDTLISHTRDYCVMAVTAVDTVEEKRFIGKEYEGGKEAQHAEQLPFFSSLQFSSHSQEEKRFIGKEYEGGKEAQDAEQLPFFSSLQFSSHSQLIFQYYLDQPDIEWTCPACALPPLTDSFFEEVSEKDTLILAEECQGETIQNIVLEQSPHRDVTKSSSDNDQLEFFRKHHNKDLLIAHLNINSIQKKIEELTEVINKINAHIMFVSETKIDASYSNAQFKVPNYSLYRNDRKKSGGGIMALISHSLVKTQLKPDKNFKTLEIIAFEIETETDNMVIVGIYRPPRALCGEYQTLLESELSHVCNWASLNRNFVVVAGDLNLNRLRPEIPEGKLLLDLEVEQGFECLITKTTRIEKRGTIITESLIDKMNHNKPKVITFRSYESFDPEHYKQLLSSAPWHIGQLFDDVDDQARVWNALMNDILDKVAPVKRMRVRDKDVPYMTSHWKSAIRAKRKVNDKYLQNKTPENWELRRKARSEATRQRRTAIKQYWNKMSNDLKKSPKAFFKTFKPFLSSKSCIERNDIHSKMTNGSMITDQQQVTEELVEHFATLADGIGGTAIEKKSTEGFWDHPCVQRIQNKNRDLTQTIEIKPVTQGQVHAALDSLNTNKATGTDGIPSKALKIGAEELSAPLTTLFNSCFDNNAWPCEWKFGYWAPVYKKDDRNAKENYWPITLLPCVSKVLEKLVGARINTALGSRFYQNSSAYRKAHSCETTLINLVEDWRLARDQRQNDLSYCLTAKLSMYADDHQIYHAGADQAAVTCQLKDSANLATTWYDSNSLAGNLEKYQVLNLGFTQNDSNICVNHVEIQTKDIIKLLGVELDCKLNFSEH